MKLYTEEQVREAYSIGYQDGIDGSNKHQLKVYKSIELPTDEQIEAYLKSFPFTKHLDDGQYNDGVIVGAELGIEWIKEQINKQLCFTHTTQN